MAQRQPRRSRRLQGRQGRVFLRDHPDENNFMRGDIINRGRQQTQFMPRVEWPQPPYTMQSRRAIERYQTDIRIPSSVYHELKATELERVLDDYPEGPPGRYLPPMPHFRHGGPYRGMPWLEHVSHCHNILEQIPQRGWLSNVQIQSLFNIASYGLENSVYFIKSDFVLYDNDIPYPEFGNQLLPRCGVMPDTGFMTDNAEHSSENNKEEDRGYDDKLEDVRKTVHEKRFIVAPVFCPNHWCMTIFDRETGQLYIMDTLRNGRERRIKGICVLWATFWDRMGLPNHFNYYALPCLEQPGQWECGYLGVAWVMHTLRNGLNQYNMPFPIPAGNNTVLQDLELVNRDESFQHVSSQPLSHWRPPGFPDHLAGDGAILELEAALCNELGIMDHEAMRGQASKPSLRSLEKGPGELGPYDSIKKIAWELLKSKEQNHQQPQIKDEEFWTRSGGPQFSFGVDNRPVDGVPRPHHLYDTTRRDYQPIYYHAPRLDPSDPYQPEVWQGLRSLDGGQSTPPQQAQDAQNAQDVQDVQEAQEANEDIPSNIKDPESEGSGNTSSRGSSAPRLMKKIPVWPGPRVAAEDVLMSNVAQAASDSGPVSDATPEPPSVTTGSTPDRRLRSAAVSPEIRAQPGGSTGSPASLALAPAAPGTEASESPSVEPRSSAPSKQSSPEPPSSEPSPSGSPSPWSPAQGPAEMEPAEPNANLQALAQAAEEALQAFAPVEPPAPASSPLSSPPARTPSLPSPLASPSPASSPPAPAAAPAPSAPTARRRSPRDRVPGPLPSRRSTRVTRAPERYGDLVDTEAALRFVRGTASNPNKRKRAQSDNAKAAQPKRRRRGQ